MLLQSIDYQIVTRWLFCGFLKMEKSNNSITQLSQAINSPSVPTAVGKRKISIEKNKEKRRTRQTLWGAVQMLTQKHVAKRYIISQKVVPLHHETERRYKYV